MDVQKSYDRIIQWQTEREQKRREVEDSICRELDEASDKIIKKLQKVNSEIDNYLKCGVDSITNKMELTDKYCNRREGFILKEIERIEKHLKGSHFELAPGVPENEEDLIDELNLQKAMSYRVIDRVLFSITEGLAPDFTLMSQSLIFRTVYLEIYRNNETYLLQGIPSDVVNVVRMGREFLSELREQEGGYLDGPDTWEVYAPKVQDWWVETALPTIYGGGCEEWIDAIPATREEMKEWGKSEISRMENFPEMYDLISLANKMTYEVSNQLNLSKITSL